MPLTWTCAKAVSTWIRVETVATPCALPEIRFAVELEEEEEEVVVEKADVFVASADSFVAMGEGVLSSCSSMTCWVSFCSSSV